MHKHTSFSVLWICFSSSWGNQKCLRFFTKTVSAVDTNKNKIIFNAFLQQFKQHCVAGFSFKSPMFEGKRCNYSVVCWMFSKSFTNVRTEVSSAAIYYHLSSVTTNCPNTTISMQMSFWQPVLTCLQSKYCTLNFIHLPVKFYQYFFWCIASSRWISLNLFDKVQRYNQEE